MKEILMGCALYLKFKDLLENDQKNLKIPKLLKNKYFPQAGLTKFE